MVRVGDRLFNFCCYGDVLYLWNWNGIIGENGYILIKSVVLIVFGVGGWGSVCWYIVN